MHKLRIFYTAPVKSRFVIKKIYASVSDIMQYILEVVEADVSNIKSCFWEICVMWMNEKYDWNIDAISDNHIDIIKKCVHTF